MGNYHTEQLLTVSEAAEIIGCSPKTLRRWEETNVLKPFLRTDKGHRRYRFEDIKPFIRKRRRYVRRSS